MNKISNSTTIKEPHQPNDRNMLCVSSMKCLGEREVLGEPWNAMERYHKKKVDGIYLLKTKIIKNKHNAWEIRQKPERYEFEMVAKANSQRIERIETSTTYFVDINREKRPCCASKGAI